MKSNKSSLWKAIFSLSKVERIVVVSFVLLSAIGLYVIVVGALCLLITQEPTYTSRNLDRSTEIFQFAVATDQEVDHFRDYDFDRYIAPGFQNLYICGELEAPVEQYLHYYVYRDGERYPIADQAQMVSPGQFCILLDVEEWLPGLSHQVEIHCGRKTVASRVFAISGK